MYFMVFGPSASAPYLKSAVTFTWKIYRTLGPLPKKDLVVMLVIFDKILFQNHTA